jgi:hypothetical protein
MELDEILEHHGIKGMKWGVRRSRSLSTSRSKTSKPVHEPASDAARAKELHTRARTAGTHTLSNQELQHLTQRMNLEQQYSRLSGSSSRKAAGARFAKEIVVNVGKQQATRMASDAVAKAVAQALKKKTKL